MPLPLEHIINWLSQLSPTQRQDTAALVWLVMPGLGDGALNEDIPDKFLAYLQTPSASGLQEYGRVLCLKTLIKHIIIARREEPNGWKKVKATLEQLGRGTGNEVFTQQAAQKQLEGAQWVASCKMWRAMAAQHLIDDVLRRSCDH